jgi:hypothetical protein
MIRASRRQRAAGLLAATLLAALALAACSANRAASGTNGAAPAAGGLDQAKEASGGGVAAVPAPTGAPNSDQTSTTLAPEPAQRSLIYTGAMTVTVKDVVKAADDAAAAAVAAGGNVSADHRNLDADRSDAQLTLRVPVNAFASTMDKLAKLGDEQTRSVQSQDVTESVVDVESRLVTQQASVDRVRALLAKANSIGEVFSIESELTRREADLDSLLSRKAKLAGLVALSTITLDLRGPAAAGVTPAAPESGFLAGLKSGWAAFTGSVKVFLTVAGWLLPWLVAIGIPVWLIVRFSRRRRANTAASYVGRPLLPGTPPATATAAPTPPPPTGADPTLPPAPPVR